MKKMLYLGLSLFLLLSLCACSEKEELQSPTWNILSASQTEEGMEVKIAGENLLTQHKVAITADSEENETYTIDNIHDGIYKEESRWSSENNWENPEHWVQVTFPEPVTIGAVRLYWERLNACWYALEVSEDGKNWETVLSMEQSPSDKCETLIFKESPEARFLRLHILDVTKLEEDASLYYQNISLLEMEVYGAIEDEFVIKTPVLEAGINRKLELPQVPEGYEIAFAGANYEVLIDKEGYVSDTISDTQVEIGYSLYRDNQKAELPAMLLTIPGSDKKPENHRNQSLPEGYEPMEWQPAEGNYSLKEQVYIFIEEGAGLEQTAEIFAEELRVQTGVEVQIQIQNIDDTLKGDKEQISNVTKSAFYLKILQNETNILGEEGFQLSMGTEADNITVIEGKTLAAIRWGCVSVLKLLEENGSQLPKGIIRDYPAYEVRGFGIDVGRRAISLDMLYNMVKAMSREKMNTLQVHLNDNQIITQSQHDGTLEGVRSLYAGFRLESNIKNEKGVGITSADLYYTKEEFRQFIEWASAYGVQVVPEIDTPGHSLALIKVFPELGIKNAETADLLDVSKKQARQLVKEIWHEYLAGDGGKKAVFEDCEVVHIGMDEYFGKADQYISYLTEIADYIKELAPEKKIRMWGSLTEMNCDYSKVSRDVEIQLWNTDWANPAEMYEAGFNIINSQNTRLYIVPGTGYDWLEIEYLAKEWEPNVFEMEGRKWEMPSYSDQMLGACYMMWNDMAFFEDMYITEDDLFKRFEQPLEIISDKLWH